MAVSTGQFRLGNPLGDNQVHLASLTAAGGCYLQRSASARVHSQLTVRLGHSWRQGTCIMRLVVLLLAGLALARCQSESQSEVVTNTTGELAAGSYCQAPAPAPPYGQSAQPCAAAEAKPERFTIQPGKGRCDEPVLDTATGLTTQTCYSPQITMAPGEVSLPASGTRCCLTSCCQVSHSLQAVPQIVDELYIFESPYPADETVGAVHHMSNIVEADTGRLVPLSEVYVSPIWSCGKQAAQGLMGRMP